MTNELTTEIIACLREHASFKCIEGNEKRMVLAASDLLEAKDAEIAALHRIVDSARHALNNSRDDGDAIALAAHDAAALSLLLDEFDAAINQAVQPRPLTSDEHEVLQAAHADGVEVVHGGKAGQP